jgi:hypothetical protein
VRLMFLPDDTVCALADHILNVVLFGHVKGDLTGSLACSTRRHVEEPKTTLETLIRKKGRFSANSRLLSVLASSLRPCSVG